MYNILLFKYTFCTSYLANELARTTAERGLLKNKQWKYFNIINTALIDY